MGKICRIVKEICWFITLTLVCCSWSCSSPEQLKGNIQSLNVKVDLQSDVLIMNLLISPIDGGTVRFKIPAYKQIQIDFLHNEEHQDVSFTNEAGYYTVKADSVNLQYKVNLQAIEQSISSIFNLGQCIFLPESGFLPTNGDTSLIDYSIEYAESIEQYEYHPGKCRYKQTLLPPSIILGDFLPVKKGNVTFYLPPDKQVLGSLIDSIASYTNLICEYYSRVLGPNSLSNDLSIFFVRRRGGYSSHEGILLSEDFLFKEIGFDFISVLSHEIAHLWWGIGVNMISWSLGEGLSEFSSMQFLRYLYGNNQIIRDKNISLLEDVGGPQNVEMVTPGDSFYRSYSYQRLPILLNEISNKTGVDHFNHSLYRLFSEYSVSKNVLTINDLVSFFPRDISDDVCAKMKGLVKNWPDYYISEVSGCRVVLAGAFLFFSETIPVEVAFKDGRIIEEHITLSPTCDIVRKEYDGEIAHVVIDPCFITNQSNTLNDSWSLNRSDSQTFKWQFDYPPRYRHFESYLEELLFSQKVQPEIENKSLEFLRNKLSSLSVDGSLFCANPETGYFTWYVAFIHKEDKGIGWVKGTFYDDGSKIELRSIKRVHF